jgi:undecaprenyl-diphosphatase
MTLSWLEAVALGIIQGITEFLPISSDGHLAVAQHLFARGQDQRFDGERMLFFTVMLHVGTLAAIVVYERRRVMEGARALMGQASSLKRPEVIRAGMLTFLATIPAGIAGLTLKDRIEAATATLWMSAAGFLVTASAIGLTGWIREGRKGLWETSWLDALLIGSAQALALLPGVSRSGMTIASALALGLTRSWAVGFSLLMAVAGISAATAKMLMDADLNALSSDEVDKMAVGAVTALVVGYGAVIGLVRIVQRGWLWYFSVYLVILALIVFSIDRPVGVARDAGPSSGPSTAASSHAVGRALGAGPVAGGSSGAPGRRIDHALDRAERECSADLGAFGAGERPGLDLG